MSFLNDDGFYIIREKNSVNRLVLHIILNAVQKHNRYVNIWLDDLLHRKYYASMIIDPAVQHSNFSMGEPLIESPPS